MWQSTLAPELFPHLFPLFTGDVGIDISSQVLCTGVGRQDSPSIHSVYAFLEHTGSANGFNLTVP